MPAKWFLENYLAVCDCVNSNTYANTHTCVREVPSGWYGGWRKPPYAPIFLGMLPPPPIFLWGQPPQTASVFLLARLRVLLNFFKNFLCWNVVERLQWAISKKRVLWCSKKVLSKMLLYCDSSWFLILIEFRSMGLTAQGLSEWRWESLF